ncbi:MAG: acyl-CoA dehydrogenase family protein [Pseudomonadota bacterium]
MNLDLSDEDKAFEATCSEFLDTHLSEEIRESTAQGTGVWGEFELAMRWQRILHKNNRVAPSWPKEYGGREWSFVQRYIWENLLILRGAPRIPAMGINMCGPVLMRYGTEDQKQTFLPRILSGEDFWCQGYSEPNAGSDLAALQCRAVPDGDDYIINGTKIWTTYAQFSNWIFCLVRTADTDRPQAGISFILIPMTAKGISVTPILSVSGDHEVNQVFFDDVRVPAQNIVGDVNGGWDVAKYLLEHERGGGSFAARLKHTLTQIKQISKARCLDADFQRKVFEAEMRVRAIEITEKRMISQLSKAKKAGAEPSLIKLQGTEMLQELDELAIEAVDYYAAPLYKCPSSEGIGAQFFDNLNTPMVGRYLNNRAATIYGGSSEVQRNIMSKLVLRL